MTIRYLTIDDRAQIHEASNLIDQFGHATDDPKLASTCVVRSTLGGWVEIDADDVPIYTVH